MLFSSIFFLLYFLPIFLCIYFILPASWKNYFALFASILFYAWGAPTFIFILFAAVAFDFFIAQLIHTSEGRKRKLLLAAGVVFNLSILLYFKYFNFFIENINLLFIHFHSQPIAATKVILPIGISFFVFHEMSYIIDVYRRVKPPMKNIVNYALYIFLFPQLIAGPIIRFNEISDQIQDRKFQDSIDNRILGFLRFSIGLAKKVLIANVLGAQADSVFNLPITELSSSSAWIGILCYTFQIYFDFSGYSDMAIGLARMMGFIFPENFNHPYIAQSITDFWRRWHMSLSRWMRDYLYISLGGNKVSVPRMYFNLCVVFILSGFWHGAQWTFLVWGAYHGLFLVLDKLFLVKLTSSIGKYLRISITFFLVIIGWLFFRSDTIHQAFQYFKKMFSFSFKHFELSNHTLFIFFIAIVFSFIYPFAKKQQRLFTTEIGVLSNKRAVASLGISLIFFILCVGEIASNGFNPFIYFKF